MAKVKSLFVFNSAFGQKEGEEEQKLLYYFPDKEKLMTKVNDVGLCEALVQFAHSFAPSSPCQSLHTSHHQHVFFEPEPKFWIVVRMTVAQDGKSGLGKLADCVHLSLLRQCYEEFKLFHGSFSYIVENGDVDALKNHLRTHLDGYVSRVNTRERALLEIFSGIPYATLDRSTVRNYQLLSDTIKDTFPDVRHTIILRDLRLVLSDASENDTQTIVRFLLKLVNHGVKAKRKEFSADSLQMTSGLFFYNFCPNNMVFLNNEGTELVQLRMFVYQRAATTVCVFDENSTDTHLDMCRKLDKFLGSQLLSTPNRPNTSDRRNSANMPDTSVGHVYVCNQVGSVETSCVEPNAPVSAFHPPMTNDVMHVVTHLRQDFESAKLKQCEVIDKVKNDRWIAAKHINGRQLYVAVDHKNANLICIHDDVRKVSAQFSSVSFAD